MKPQSLHHVPDQCLPSSNQEEDPGLHGLPEKYKVDMPQILNGNLFQMAGVAIKEANIQGPMW